MPRRSSGARPRASAREQVRVTSVERRRAGWRLIAYSQPKTFQPLVAGSEVVRSLNSRPSFSARSLSTAENGMQEQVSGRVDVRPTASEQAKLQRVGVRHRQRKHTTGLESLGHLLQHVPRARQVLEDMPHHDRASRPDVGEGTSGSVAAESPARQRHPPDTHSSVRPSRLRSPRSPLCAQPLKRLQTPRRSRRSARRGRTLATS